MKKLIKGLHKFQTEVFPIRKNFFEDLAKGQNPDILFITCSDSRVNPNLVTSAEPGDLFILRNAGNIIPPYGQGGSEEATVEFAVSELGVKHIILCGHSYCGAVEAAVNLEKIKHLPSLYSWVKKNIEPTLEFVKTNYNDIGPENLFNILIQEHVLKQLENLKTYPIINDVVAKGNLSLHAWIYKFEIGDIFSFDANTGQFDLLRKTK